MSRPASKYTVAIRTLLDKHDGNLTHAEIRPLLVQQGFEIAAEPPTLSDAFSQFEQYDVKLDDAASVASAMKACGFDESVQSVVLHEAKVRADFKSERNNFDVTKYNWNKTKQSGGNSPSRKPVTSKNSKAKMAVVTGNSATILPRPKHRPQDAPISTTVKRRGRPPAAAPAPVVAKRRGRPPAAAPALAAPVVAKRRGRPPAAAAPATVVVPVAKRGRPPATSVVANDSLEFVAKNGGVSAVKNRITELRLEADKMERAVNDVLALQKRLSDAA